MITLELLLHDRFILRITQHDHINELSKRVGRVEQLLEMVVSSNNS